MANAITTRALLLGIPRPPYTRNNAIIIETVGRRSGRRRRIRMNRVHAAFVRLEATTPEVVEISPE